MKKNILFFVITSLLATQNTAAHDKCPHTNFINATIPVSCPICAAHSQVDPRMTERLASEVTDRALEKIRHHIPYLSLTSKNMSEAHFFQRIKFLLYTVVAEVVGALSLCLIKKNAPPYHPVFQNPQNAAHAA